VVAFLTGLEKDDSRRLAIELIEVGLGEDMGYGHLRLDPGLPPYLLGEMKVEDVDPLRSRWAEAMAGLTGFLHQQLSKDAQIAAHLTLLELPNLLAMLEWLQDRWSPERVVDLADSLERLVANLGRPQALAQATRMRERAAQKLGEWSHARYVTEDANVDRLLERGDLRAAHDAARQLLQRCLAASESAYPGAAYDLAMANFSLGRGLQRGGAAEDALPPLAEAQHRFQQLADAGDNDAEHMVSLAIVETGDCLSKLGRLDEAAAMYQRTIKLFEQKNRIRDAAVCKGQLGTVRLFQKRHAEALKFYGEARDTFEALREPRQVAAIWHQIGMVHERAGQFELAEQAYRQSLAIKVREGDLAGQASTMNQLGNLYTLQILSQLAEDPDTPPFGRALVAKLQSLLAGDRDPALASDPDLHYIDAAELLLLLETLRS
jgi:tetratricopeptide (TPR) repeat protein